MKLHVQVKLGKKNEKIQRTNNSWLISINAPATEGKANERLIEFFSEVLEIPKSKIVILKGHSSPFKTLEIESAEENVISVLTSASTR